VFGFFDESGFSDRPHIVRTWGMKGHTPVIRSHGGWKNVTAAGMIVFNTRTKRTQALSWISKKSMCKEKLLDILHTLKKKYHTQHLILLWDGLPAHKATIIRHFVEENTSWLTVIRFPAYAPELNPQEYLWSGTKRADMGNICMDSHKALRGKVYRSLKKRSCNKAFLRGCIKASGLFTARELGEGL
jgi:transposase